MSAPLPFALCSSSCPEVLRPCGLKTDTQTHLESCCIIRPRGGPASRLGLYVHGIRVNTGTSLWRNVLRRSYDTSMKVFFSHDWWAHPSLLSIQPSRAPLSSQLFAVRYWSFGDRRHGHWIRYVSKGLGGCVTRVGGSPKRSMSYIPTPAVAFGDPASLHFLAHARARKEGRRRTGRRATIKVLGEGRTTHRVLHIRSECKSRRGLRKAPNKIFVFEDSTHINHHTRK